MPEGKNTQFPPRPGKPLENNLETWHTYSGGDTLTFSLEPTYPVSPLGSEQLTPKVT